MSLKALSFLSSASKSMLSRRSLFQSIGLGFGAWIGGRLVLSQLDGGQSLETIMPPLATADSEPEFYMVSMNGTRWRWNREAKTYYSDPEHYLEGRWSAIENGTEPTSKDTA